MISSMLKTVEFLAAVSWPINGLRSPKTTEIVLWIGDSFPRRIDSLCKEKQIIRNNRACGGLHVAASFSSSTSRRCRLSRLSLLVHRSRLLRRCKIPNRSGEFREIASKYGKKVDDPATLWTYVDQRRVRRVSYTFTALAYC